MSHYHLIIRCRCVQNFSALPYRHFRLLAVAVLCISDALDIGALVAHSYGGRWPQLSSSASSSLLPNDPAVTVSVVAHCGGAVAGVLSGVIVYSARLDAERERSKAAQVCLVVVRVWAAVVALVTVRCVIY